MATKHFFKNNSLKNNTKTVNVNRNFITLSPASMKRLIGGYYYSPIIPANKPKD